MSRARKSSSSVAFIATCAFTCASDCMSILLNAGPASRVAEHANGGQHRREFHRGGKDLQLLTAAVQYETLVLSAPPELDGLRRTLVLFLNGLVLRPGRQRPRRGDVEHPRYRSRGPAALPAVAPSPSPGMTRRRASERWPRGASWTKGRVSSMRWMPRSARGNSSPPPAVSARVADVRRHSTITTTDGSARPPRPAGSLPSPARPARAAVSSERRYRDLPAEREPAGRRAGRHVTEDCR